MAEHTQERTEQATPRKKQQARRRGTVARSADLTSSSVLVAIALLAPAVFSIIGSGLIAGMRGGLTLDAVSVQSGDLANHLWRSFQPTLVGLVAIAGIALVLGLGINFAQVGFTPTAEPLNPDFSRINPVEGFKRLLSRRALFDLGKSLAKFIVIAYAAYSEVSNNWDAMLNLGALPPTQGIAWCGAFLGAVLMKAAFAWFVIAVVDYWFQKKQTDRMLMMSRDELKREMRETETSPELRQEMHRRRQRMARARMMSNVKKADVVITNPTEYAVALLYEPSKRAAPVVLARGRHLVAERIRQEAKKHRVPIVPNPPLARSLYEEVDLGEMIPAKLFQAVAEVLAYVFKQKGKKF
ncbi:MAG: Flagellar biosynthetic protein FlhB [Fimbriimonadales bacterium]|nr:Flagellar biosynthetic protein FlhB [Fimbriimonadales bacterium]